MNNQKTELVFMLWSDDTGVFFAKKNYEHLKTVEAALNEAETWRDFERMCPPGEFEDLGMWWCNRGEYIYEIDGEYRFIDSDELVEFLRDDGREQVIGADEKFNRSMIPGGDDGDYPPWTMMTADKILPGEFADEFSEGAVGGPAAGGWWIEYPVAEIDEMTRWLEPRGFSVTAHLQYD